MIQGHGGNIYAMARQLGCRPDDIVDMSSNINPIGMPPGLEAFLHDRLHRIGALPEADADGAIGHMAALLDVDARHMLAGNGTTQFIYSACPALGSRKALIVGPTYADYADACRMHRVEVFHFLTRADDRFELNLPILEMELEGCDTVFICNPNNPTGGLVSRDLLRELCRSHPGIHFIIDESYLPFAAANADQSMMVDIGDNVSVLWSLSKIFGVPGVRAGFLMARPATISRFQRFMQPWSLNTVAQSVVDYLGRHREAVHAFVEKTVDYLATERERFYNIIDSQSTMTPYPSQASYLLMKLPRGVDADAVCRSMSRKRILIRNCDNFTGLSERFVRVALKDPQTNQRAAVYLVEIVQRLVAG